MTSNRLIAVAVLSACAHIASPIAAAADPAARPHANTPAATMAKDDVRYFEQLARANLAEIQAGELAADKATAPAVKQYATRMIAEHKPMLEALRALGQSKGLALPSTLDEKHMAAMKRLHQQTGETFERSYMTTMVKDHKEVLELLEDIAANARDRGLQAMAKDAVPKIKSHLEEAMRTADNTALPERVYSTPPKGR